MKDLKNLKGAKMLSKMEQKGIKGGKEQCGLVGGVVYYCHVGFCCVNGACYPIGEAICEPYPEV